MTGSGADSFFDVARALTHVALPAMRPVAWDSKHPLNIPGPIYVGDDCSCGAGPVFAPNNVILLDDNDEKYVAVNGKCPQGGEFIFRQPTSMFELKQVVFAASINVMRVYAFDGNLRWTPKGVVAWWRDTHKYYSALAKRVDEHVGYPRPSFDLQRWHMYLEDGIEQYLREYCYFLETGRAPPAGAKLPDL